MRDMGPPEGNSARGYTIIVLYAFNATLRASTQVIASSYT